SAGHEFSPSDRGEARRDDDRGYASGAHARALRIECRGGQALCLAPGADDLDLESTRLAGQGDRDVSEGERALHTVTVSARGHPTDDLAVVPDRLIPQCIRIGGLHREADEPQRSAALSLFERRGAADELALLQVHEPSEAGLERPVDRPE